MNLADEVAALRQEVEGLKRSLDLRPLWSTPSTRPRSSVVVPVEMEGHGFSVGLWVLYAGDFTQWIPALARPYDPTASSIPLITGVVTRVFSPNRFEVTISGYVEGINNPEDEIDGEFSAGNYYSLSETVAGTLTYVPTTTRIRCFQALGPHSGIVIQSVECQAELFYSSGNIPAAKVVNNLGDLADPAVDTNRAFLGVTINDFTGAANSVVCRSGIVVFPDSVSLPGGTLWLDPTSPGELTGTKPATPADQRPIPIMVSLGAHVYWVNPPWLTDTGVGDLWDVDTSTPPADGETLVWDDTGKRWKPGSPGLGTEAEGPSVVARIESGVGPVVAFQATTNKGVLTVDTGVLVWQLVRPENMEHRAAYGVLANATAATAAMTELTAEEGTVFGRVGSTMGFGSNPELGTAADGGGYLKIHFATDKYFEFDTDGSFRIYHSASLSLEVSSTGVVTLTYGSSNTVTIDPADIVGTGRELKIRELDICDATGTPKKIQLLCTAAY